MPKHKINWVNDHTEIYDRLNERVQLMQDYLDSRFPTLTASRPSGSS